MRIIAQDIGSAIVGPARTDLYFEAGDEAGQVAGRIRQYGRFAILLPRDLDLAAAGARMSLLLKPPPSQIAARASQPRRRPRYWPRGRSRGVHDRPRPSGSDRKRGQLNKYSIGK